MLHYSIIRSILRIIGGAHMARYKRRKIPRKLTMTGKYTYYVTIPREYIEALGWRKKQKLTLKLSGKKIIVEDWKR